MDHNSLHSNSDCYAFRSSSISERKDVLRKHRQCFKCCVGKHLSSTCNRHVYVSVTVVAAVIVVRLCTIVSSSDPFFFISMHTERERERERERESERERGRRISSCIINC